MANKLKGVSIKLPDSLHTALKIWCANKGVKLKDAIPKMIERGIAR